MNKTIIVISLLAFGLSHSCKNNVYQWRGANRDGIYHETKLLDQWPEEGPELLWVSKGLGRGYAAPVITEDQIFVNGEQEGKSYLYAFDLEGKQLWRSPNGEEFLGEGFSSTYPGARSTPTVMGKLVYTTSGKGRIACFDKSTGTEKWTVNIVDDLGGELGYFGYSESVAVDNEKVYCYPGGAENKHGCTGQDNRKDGLDLGGAQRYFCLWFTCSGGPAIPESPDPHLLASPLHSRLRTGRVTWQLYTGRRNR